jgi:hypothetical protein
MSSMKVFTTLAALVATAGLVVAQDGTYRRSPNPEPAGKPTHDPSAETVRQFAGDNSGVTVILDNYPPAPAPAIVFQGQDRGSEKGRVEIIPIKGKSLADTLTLDRRGRVWWDYAREVDSIVSPP